MTRVEPSLEACFVDYGEDRHGFLPFKEVSKNYFREGTDVRNARIQDALKEGDSLLVQVEKEERGNKGAALTTFVSLAGRYLVLMPNNPRGGGVSRRIEGEDRAELKENLDQLEYPKGMSLIARTAGIGRTAPELQWDLNYMLKLWTAIDAASKEGKGAFLIYQESSLVIRAIRDYFTADIGEILIDTDDIYEQAHQFMSHVMPEAAPKVKRYRDDAPLFSRFQIEHQIETAFSRTVNLPSGGAIVIDHTEALVSVDMNSARSTRGSDIEETATRTNLEAADEIARQMRLRDLGGLIVVDFIDMEESKNRRDVEGRLRDALRQDRARVQFSSISKFGLLELSRQRLRPALSEGSHITCPRCNGTGHIRDTESSALQILRMVQEEAMKDNTAAVHVQVPVEVTSFLLNEKRPEITKIELKQRITVLLVPNKHLETPNYKLERLRHDDPRLESLQVSYSMIEEPDDEVGITRREKTKAKQEPVIKGILPDTAAPIAPPKPEPVALAPVAAAPAPVAPVAPASGGGFFAWVKKLFGVEESKPVATPTPAPAAAQASNEQRREGRGDRNNRGNRGGRDGRRGERGERSERGERGAEKGEQRAGERGAERGERSEQRGERNERGNRGRRNERGDRPDEAQAEGAPRQEERSRRPETGEESAEARNEGRRDNRRGGQAPRPAPVESAAGLDEATQARAFVDTVPGETSEAQGDAQGERGGRRRRRGGRGRDRDEARNPEVTEALAGEEAPSVLPSESAPASTAEEATVADADGAAPTDGNERGEREGGRRRRGRGGRDRQRREEGGDGSAPMGEAGAADSAVADAEAAMLQPVPVEARFVNAAEPQALAADATDATAEAPQAAPVEAPVAAPAAPVETPKPVTTAAAVVVEPYVLNTHQLQGVAESAGLQWVNSDADKIRAVQEAMAREPKPVHVPREIQPPVAIDEGPLVLVETRKDLSQVRLPFETPSQPSA